MLALTLICFYLKQVRFEKAKSAEIRLEEERRQLLNSLDSAAARYTEAEVERSRLEGELRRSTATVNESQMETQVSKLESIHTMRA